MEHYSLLLTTTKINSCVIKLLKIHPLEFVPECYKTHKIGHKVVDTHPSTLQFVPEYYKTQEMCYKALQRCFVVFDSILDQYKTQEMYLT